MLTKASGKRSFQHANLFVRGLLADVRFSINEIYDFQVQQLGEGRESPSISILSLACTHFVRASVGRGWVRMSWDIRFLPQLSPISTCPISLVGQTQALSLLLVIDWPSLYSFSPIAYLWPLCERETGEEMERWAGSLSFLHVPVPSIRQDRYGREKRR